MLKAQMICMPHCVYASLQDGESPLSVAAFRGHLEVVRALLEENARVNQASQVCACASWCARERVMSCSHNEAMHTCSVHVLQRMSKALTCTSLCVYGPRQDGSSPLFVAAFGGHLEVVQELLKGGADANQADKVGQAGECVGYLH